MDTQFMKMLEANARLISLGNDLVQSIKSAKWANTDGSPLSIHMQVAIKGWKKEIEENYITLPKETPDGI